MDPFESGHRGCRTGKRTMRLSATLIAALVAMPTVLYAADYGVPPLPEAPALDQPVGANWGGIYGGIFAGYSNGSMNTESSAVDLATRAYRNSSAQALATSIAYLPTDFSNQTPSYGGFVGVNWVWDDVILGLEAEYSGFNPVMKDSGSYSAARRSDGATSQVVDYTATATTKVTSYGILKLRAGYAMGRFLPFATVGLAVGKGELNATYNSLYSEYPIVGGVPVFGAPIISNQPFDAAIKNRGWMVGGSAGVGLDMLLTDNVFARVEYTYVGFAPFHGQTTALNTIKAGIAVKY
jgi:outer membrane immunogenic protein